jgi:hypothetical protein
LAPAVAVAKPRVEPRMGQVEHIPVHNTQLVWTIVVHLILLLTSEPLMNIDLLKATIARLLFYFYFPERM